MFNLKSSKNPTFIIQAGDQFLKVVKYCPDHKGSPKKYSFHFEPLPIDTGPEDLADKLDAAFRKLGYDHGPVIICLLRSQATCRYLKVPSQNSPEIEKIVNLQAGRYLPYSPDELVSGFEVVLASGGYSGVNQVIVHKEIIEKYNVFLKRLKIVSPRVLLSSLGLSNLYNYLALHRQPVEPVMIIDIDVSYAEIVITVKGKVFFSRTFKLTASKPGWQSGLISETERTIDAFIKETGQLRPVKIVLTADTQLGPEAKALFSGHFNAAVELLDAKQQLFQQGVSFTGLIGLSLGSIPRSLDLLTGNFKQQQQAFNRQKGIRQFVLFGCGIAVILLAAMAKDIDNKSRYLAVLNKELNTISDDARVLSRLDKKLKFLDSRRRLGPAVLDVLHEINQALPKGSSLSYFNYADGRELVLRGQAGDLNDVFNFASYLEKSGLLQKFGLKVKYATKNKNLNKETVDFEISGSK